MELTLNTLLNTVFMTRTLKVRLLNTAALLMTRQTSTSKTLLKAVWSIKVCVQDGERKAYEKALDEEHRLGQEEEDVQIQEARIKKITSNAKDCFKMVLSRLYEDEVKESESSTNVLLLPTVKSEEGDEGKQLDNLGIRGIQRVGVQRMLRSLKIEKCKALNDACTYRDIAERLKKNRDDLHRMSNKVEVVQDYWRNQLYEGRSRSEKMVKLALSGSQN